MLVLLDAKHEDFLEELDVVDGRDLMDFDVTKWSHISDKVLALGT